MVKEESLRFAAQAFEIQVLQIAKSYR